MPTKIFFSWQSDRKQNRNFVRSILDLVAKEVAQDPELSDALRDVSIDQDTQDVPGSPAIADTILTKISSSDIFVADLTFVDDGSNPDRRTPNPNVMLEYGYALSSLGGDKIVSVINTAYGPPSELPFDLKHRRWPICFNLSEASSAEDKAAEKTKLKAALKAALKAHIKSAVTRNNEVPRIPPFVSLPPADGVGRFLSSDKVLCVQGDGTEDAQEIQLAEGPYTFLRLMPALEQPRLGHREAYRIAQSSLGTVLATRSGNEWTGRSETGAVRYSALAENLQRAISASQLFLTRELWAVDTYLLSRKPADGATFSFIPTGAFEDMLTDALINFAQIASTQLGIATPVNIHVGIVGAQGFTLAVDQARFWGQYQGRILSSSITHKATLSDWNTHPYQILKPFFEKIYDDAGLERPDDAPRHRRQWTPLMRLEGTD